MKVGILAVQGAFLEHEQMLDKLGISYVEIRQKRDLDQDFQGLILPGGESTVQSKLLREQDMFFELQDRIINGLPTLGTCAGLILLAKHLSNDSQTHLGTLPVTVRRNAYGRQLGSFYTESEFKNLGQIPMTFIRAPYIENADSNVEVLATVKDNIVGVKFNNQIGISFHPELDAHLGIHTMFLDMISCKSNKQKSA